MKSYSSPRHWTKCAISCSQSSLDFLLHVSPGNISVHLGNTECLSSDPAVLSSRLLSLCHHAVAGINNSTQHHSRKPTSALLNNILRDRHSSPTLQHPALAPNTLLMVQLLPLRWWLWSTFSALLEFQRRKRAFRWPTDRQTLSSSSDMRRLTSFESQMHPTGRPTEGAAVVASWL